MIEIDGSHGEGGGQIIRSSLALSAVTKQPIKLRNIRAGRKQPGLLRQHLTAVLATAEVCQAEVSGAELGSQEMTFAPQQIRAGDFVFEIGTAGSATLVAQTVLPALMMADSPSTVTVTGGTHNQWAPPFEFLQRSYLPLLAKAGPTVTAEIESFGFYPAGGGRIQLNIEPRKQLVGFELVDRDKQPEPLVTAIVAGLPSSIGRRECETIRRKTNWNSKCFHVQEVTTTGPGNVVMIALISRDVTEIFTGFGKLGVPAEQVARNAWREAESYLQLGVPVGEHLADQLMMPMGLAASQGQSCAFRTSQLSLHSRTHIDVLKLFLDIEIVVEDQGSDTLLVRLAG